MFAQAQQQLQSLLGTDATFRDGQWDAIRALVEDRQRVLVVQRTGWGKSLVYFMATRLLRERGAGVTLIISPLLSLMRNQLESAAGWGLKAATINSDNADEHANIERQLLQNEIDVLLVSPERLSNSRFQRNLWRVLSKRLGLLVVDEAHCISDWGHDFRPNYRRIMGLLNDVPRGTAVLGTTATANDRVVKDVSAILGTGGNNALTIQRGPLTRDSLLLYVYPDPMSAAARLTLLSHLMTTIKGSGIIYCSTTRDCQRVADWLQMEGHNVKAYFADVEQTGTDSRADLERQLMNNEVKALVSSVALGMGFDKSDLRFVLHYQLPGNLINYYQQIGRAGRGIDRAYIVLMYGKEDEDIQRYFIESAFPTPQQVRDVTSALAEHGDLTRPQIQKYVNVRFGVLEKILTHLEVEEIINRAEDAYHLLRPDAHPDYARWETVTEIRYQELAQMKEYIKAKTCLMHFMAQTLDDPYPVERCGRCKNCTGAKSKFDPDPRAIARASQFLFDGNAIPVPPRKKWPHRIDGTTTITSPNYQGWALCNFYEEGYGKIVRDARQAGHYPDDLVQASAALLLNIWKNAGSQPKIIVPVPSLTRPTLVPDFAARLADALGMRYVEAVEQVEPHAPQLQMRNSTQAITNLRGKFAVEVRLTNQPILLVDDIADSRWTLTVIGDLLRSNGTGPITPFVLSTMQTSD